MPHLKYYASERREFKKEQTVIMSNGEIELFYDEACKAFNLMRITVTFEKSLKNYSGLYNEHHRLIMIKEKSLFVVVHELAHHMDSQLNGRLHKRKRSDRFRKAHTKMHRGLMIKLFDYYKYWVNPTRYDTAQKITIKGETK